ncbi:MAG: hypothetical protein RR988_04380 [Clostridia bacterium]
MEEKQGMLMHKGKMYNLDEMTKEELGDLLIEIQEEEIILQKKLGIILED